MLQKNNGTSLAWCLIYITFTWYLKKEQEDGKEEEEDDNSDYAYNIKPTVSELNGIMDLSEQQISGSHTVFGQLTL
jgi:hypothetical protein